MEELLSETKLLGLRVVVDFVPDLSSDESESSRVAGFEKFYIWKYGISTVAGDRPLPPNHWQ